MKIIYVEHDSEIIETLVDDCDYDYLCQFKWFFHKGRRNNYIATTFERQTTQMGVIIAKRMGLVFKDCIDHKDRNRLNNQRSNLRTATCSENAINRPMRPDNTSGYRGVYFDKSSQKWLAQIKVRGTRLTLGRFKILEEAAKIYNRAAIKYYGEFAVLNEV